MALVRIGLILKRGKGEAEEIARNLIEWLKGRGCEVYAASEQATLLAKVIAVPEGELANHVDALVVLGGDGTLLHGAGLVGDTGVPVLGVNLGRLGFLTPFDPATVKNALERALAGTLAVEERMRLNVELVTREKRVSRFALNDAVISQGAMARLIELEAILDGNRISLYRADGLIVCTPTGSTAYNLSAGGPILTPEVASMVITPICPHTLTHRPLVVPAMGRIQLELKGDSRGAILTVDGQWAQPLSSGDRIEVSRAQQPMRLYRAEKTHFEILREKLGWGEREVTSTRTGAC